MALNLNSKSLYIGNTWYLSAMMIAILILYPLMLRDYHFSVKILFPIGTLFLLGYLYGKDGYISNWKEFYGFTYGGILRAAAEMGLGATCFEISKLLSSGGIARKTEASALAKLGVTLFKYGCYMVVLCYGHSKLGGITFKTDFDLHALLFCAIAVTLSFSGIGYSIPDTRLTRYLAKISLPIYIFHGLFRVCFEEYLGTTDVSLKVAALIIVSSVLISVALMYLIDFAVNYIHAKKASG